MTATPFSILKHRKTNFPTTRCSSPTRNLSRPPIEPITYPIDVPGALDDPAQTVAQYTIALSDAMGEPVTDTIGTVFIGLDLRNLVPPEQHIWAAGLQPAEDNTSLFAPEVETFDDSGLIGFRLDDLSAFAEWNLDIETAGSEPQNSRVSSDSPKPWKPSFNAPTVSEFSGASDLPISNSLTACTWWVGT